MNALRDLSQASDTNPKGATLVFTIHRPEVLDCVHRKDNVHFLARNPQSCRARTMKYSFEVKRIDEKEGGLFLSNYVGGTAPKTLGCPEAA